MLSAENKMRSVRIMQVRRGDIFYADLSPVVGSEQGGVRPVLIIQNDIGNRFSPTVIAAAITSQRGKTELPTHIHLQAATTGLSRDSIVLLEQVRTLDKHRLREYMGRLGEAGMAAVDRALSVSFGLVSQPRHPVSTIPAAAAQVSHGAAT
jgi:mRNA interferase MazF